MSELKRTFKDIPFNEAAVPKVLKFLDGEDRKYPKMTWATLWQIQGWKQIDGRMDYKIRGVTIGPKQFQKINALLQEFKTQGVE